KVFEILDMDRSFIEEELKLFALSSAETAAFLKIGVEEFQALVK
uniref:Parvalbumin beta (Fragments) n=1 Tax=Rana temporaria TaxID=8407 RepID=PRVB_RANTE|nr:RecName: Full=Parvalbumin beta [Rana temporaria]